MVKVKEMRKETKCQNPPHYSQWFGKNFLQNDYKDWNNWNRNQLSKCAEKRGINDFLKRKDN